MAVTVRPNTFNDRGRRPFHEKTVLEQANLLWGSARACGAIDHWQAYGPIACKGAYSRLKGPAAWIDLNVPYYGTATNVENNVFLRGGICLRTMNSEGIRNQSPAGRCST